MGQVVLPATGAIDTNHKVFQQQFAVLAALTERRGYICKPPWGRCVACAGCNLNSQLESSIVVVSPNESSTIHEWTEAALRFRAAGMAVLTLACVGWLLWFTPFDDLLDRSGTPLGGDFVMLYVAGQVVASGQSQEL